jgi:hypothetical protein
MIEIPLVELRLSSSPSSNTIEDLSMAENSTDDLIINGDATQATLQPSSTVLDQFVQDPTVMFPPTNHTNNMVPATECQLAQATQSGKLSALVPSLGFTASRKGSNNLR